MPNFPVKAFETRLRNLTGKLTYALSQNNKLTAYAQGGQKLQPNRLDRFLVGADVARHSARSRPGSSATGATPTRPATSRCWATTRSSSSAAASSSTSGRTSATARRRPTRTSATNIVSGGNRDGWFNIPSRNQVAGSITYYKDGWAGSHNFKAGGEWFRETFTYDRGTGGVDGVFPGDVLHVLNNGAPAEVLLFQTPSISEQGLRTTGFYLQDTWRMTSRLTMNLGFRFDRYRSFLPEQEGPQWRALHGGDGDALRRGERRQDVQPPGAAHRPHLRRHRRGPHRHQGQLRQVLLESRVPTLRTT